MIGIGILTALVGLVFYALIRSAGMADRKLEEIQRLTAEREAVAQVGINVRVQKSPKPLDVIEVEAKLERDLRSCMRCRFFYGNNRQCIAKKCVKEDAQPKAVEQEKEDKCIGCPYRQSERYCFPCMKKLLGIEEKEHEKEIVFEQEEKKDG